MTLLPLENRDVKGLRAKHDFPDVGRLPAYKVGPDCAVPGCGRFADHAHHLWRRSFLGGPFEYVLLPDGSIIGNLTGLCWSCHEEVTQNRAVIKWSQEDLDFLFYRIDDVGSRYVGTIDRPPLVRLGAVGPGLPVPPDRKSTRTEVQADSAETCEVCGAKKRTRKELPPGEKRPKRTWAVAVPVDHREDGHEIIETLLEDARDALGRGDEKSWKYYTLVEVLAFFSQHRHEVAA